MPDKRIILLTSAKPGNVNDIRQLRETLVEKVPGEAAIECNLGFQDLQKEFGNIHLLHKRPSRGELNEAQKQKNKLLSPRRIVCKYAHSGMKQCNSVTVIYRNQVSDFNYHLMLTAAGL